MKKILGLAVVLVAVIAVRYWARQAPEAPKTEDAEKPATVSGATKEKSVDLSPQLAGFDGLPKAREPERPTPVVPTSPPQIYPEAQEDLSFLDTSPYPDPYYRGDNAYGRSVPYPGPDEVIRDFDGEEIEVYRN